MKIYKTSKISLLACLFIGSFLLSCVKDDTTYTDTKPEIKKEAIADWIDDHKPKLISSEDKEMLGLVSRNLEYNGMKVEKRNNGENIIIVPMTDSVKTELKIDHKSIVNMMIVQGTSGKMRWSTIVSYTPKPSQKQPISLSKTISDIVNNKKVADDGLYKFLDIKGNLLYQMEYKNGKLKTHATVIKSSDRLKNNSKKNKDNKLANMAPPPPGEGYCIDWYLVTTEYDDWGNIIDYYETYLYTQCYGGSGGGGGSGGTPPAPEDPNDQETVVSGTAQETETSYTDDDLAVPGAGGTSIGGGAPYANPVVFLHKYDYGRRTFGPFYITWIYMYDAIASPPSDTYPHPTKGYVTRSITIFDMGKYATNNTTTATLDWNYQAHYRYTYSGSSGVYTRQQARSYSMTVPFAYH